MLLLPPGSAIVDRSTGLHSPASTQSLRPPTTHRRCRWSKVSVICLSPVHFRGLRARQVSCYALFEEWLLLSLSSCCLCSKTPFCLTLSRYLGTLTLVWVVPLSVMRLTPHKPASQLLRRLYIRSSNGRRALSSPYRPIGALQNKQSQLRQDCDPLRWELAITGLDWFLTPNLRSGDRFARQDPCRPPVGFRPPSSCPRIDRPVSSLTAMTKDPFRSFASP
jgi:hypothetical protein